MTTVAWDFDGIKSILPQEKKVRKCVPEPLSRAATNKMTKPM
jgi:hypothetical protein